MATKVIVTEQYLKDVANAIRTKLKTEAPIKTKDMATEILHILTPEGNLEITENGNYDVTEKEEVTVNVPNPSTGTLEITENGTYDVTDKELAHVEVPEVPIAPTTINVNGVHSKQSGGWNPVTVSVPPYSKPNETKEITQNGTYTFRDDPSSQGEVPPASIRVAVPPYGEGTLDLVISEEHGSYDVEGYKRADISVSTDELTVTENGIYQPRYDQMIIGYTKVTVNCPIPKILTFSNNWFQTEPEYNEDYDFSRSNILMVDGRPSSMNPLSVGDKIVATLNVSNMFWMVRGTIKTITETTVTATLDFADIIN